MDEGDSETLSPGNYKKGTIKKDATLRLTAGDYTFKEEFKLEEGARIIINSGSVRLLVKKGVKIEKEVVINSGGSASDLLIYSRDKIEIKEDASVTAFLYSKGDYKQEKNTTVNGAASGKKVELKENSVINFLVSEQANADFGDLCEGGGGDLTPPVLDSATAACTALTTVNVSFSETLDNATASSTGNYSLVNTDTSSSIAISSAAVSNNTVTLTTATLATGNYQLTANNVEDSSGNVIDNNSQASFSLDCDLPDPRLEYRFDQCDLSTGVPDSANS